MLRPGWCRVLELQQRLFDIVFHAGFKGSFAVVPFEVDSNISRARPVHLDGIVLLE